MILKSYPKGLIVFHSKIKTIYSANLKKTLVSTNYSLTHRHKNVVQHNTVSQITIFQIHKIISVNLKYFSTKMHICWHSEEIMKLRITEPFIKCFEVFSREFVF